MSNIERWWLVVNRRTGQIARTGNRPITTNDPLFKVVEVEVVPAEQLREAVDAIRNVRRAALVGLTANDQTARLYKGALARVVEITDDALKGQ